MATGEKFRRLAEYLRKSGQDKITLTYAEIEKILGFSLSPSAYTYRPYWGNASPRSIEKGTAHSIAISWANVGYKTVEVSLGKYVVFEKERKY